MQLGLGAWHRHSLGKDPTSLEDLIADGCAVGPGVKPALAAFT
jgi:hypothetical protein